MTLFQFILIQVNLFFLYGLFTAFTRSSTRFKFNRFYLLFTPIVAVVLPFIELNFQASQSIAVIVQEVAIVAQPIKSTTTELLSPLIVVYIIGLLAHLIFFGWNLAKAMRHEYTEVLLHMGRVKVVRANCPNSFSFYNTIYISNRTEEHIDLIVEHELAHIQQKHTFDLIYFAFIRSVLWFNPVLILWNKKIKENHEYLADEEVMNSNVALTDYAQALLQTHLNSAYPHFGNGFNAPSLIRKRIIKMKHKNKKYMKHLILIPMLGITLYATTSLNGTIQPIQTVITNQVSDPQFPGGQEGLIQFMMDNVHYPKEAAKNGSEGIVYVGCVIDESGNVTNPTILKGAEDETLNQEAIRVVEAMPKWKPATKDGKAVKAEIQLPINFTLGK